MTTIPTDTGLELNEYAPLNLTTDIPCEQGVFHRDTANTLPIYPKADDLGDWS